MPQAVRCMSVYPFSGIVVYFPVRCYNQEKKVQKGRGNSDGDRNGEMDG